MQGYHHKILIVDGEAKAGKSFLNILETEKIKFVYVDNAKAGLEKISSASQPFSLIICDQGTTGMTGTKFLEQVRKNKPDTIRILISKNLDMQTIINAVNQGHVQKYLSTPLDHDTIFQAIYWGIEQYELFLNKENLFLLAKKQNTKLYELNCELMEKTKRQNKEMTTLDNELEAIETKVKSMHSTKTMTPGQIMEVLQTFVSSQENAGQEKFSELFSQTIKTLFNEFSDLALRNGFEMPEPTGGSND